MEAKVEVLKRAALSGVLDDLPLDALKVYLLLVAWAKAVDRESRVRLRMLQETLGGGFSGDDCQRALAILASHRLLTWAPVSSRTSGRRQGSEGKNIVEIIFRLNLLHH